MRLLVLVRLVIGPHTIAPVLRLSAYSEVPYAVGSVAFAPVVTITSPPAMIG